MTMSSNGGTVKAAHLQIDPDAGRSEEWKEGLNEQRTGMMGVSPSSVSSLLDSGGDDGGVYLLSESCMVS